MLKLLWPFLIVNLRIPGLIWWGMAYFAQNNTTNILLGKTQQTRSKLPVAHFWSEIRSLETQNISYFSLFAIWYEFWKWKDLVENIYCHLQQEKLPNLIAFPINIHWHQDSKGFPACWILTGQFKFQLCQPYARYVRRTKNLPGVYLCQNFAFAHIPPSSLRVNNLTWNLQTNGKPVPGQRSTWEKLNLNEVWTWAHNMVLWYAGQ